jgi:hypothetical protein
VPVTHACTDPGNSELRNIVSAISITSTINVVRDNDVSRYNAKPAVLGCRIDDSIGCRIGDSDSHRFPERR